LVVGEWLIGGGLIYDGRLHFEGGVWEVSQGHSGA
jgi:hypothetical protein